MIGTDRACSEPCPYFLFLLAGGAIMMHATADDDDHAAEQIGEGALGRLPVYGLWLLDTCLEMAGAKDKSVVEFFVKVGGLQQVCA